MQVTFGRSLALLLSFHLSSVFAGPDDIGVEESPDLQELGRSKTPDVTGTGQVNDPFIYTIDCSKFTEVCEAQCTAIICFKAPQNM